MRLRSRRRFRVSGGQLLLSLILGTVGGIYIWKPEFDRRFGPDIEADRQKTIADFDKEEPHK